MDQQTIKRHIEEGATFYLDFKSNFLLPRLGFRIY